MRLLAVALLGAILVGVAPTTEPFEPARKPSGIEKRTLWTTSKVQGSPEPPPPYLMERAFPKLQFNEPLEIAAVPGGHRMIVAERRGKLFTFVTNPEKPDKHLL